MENPINRFTIFILCIFILTCGCAKNNANIKYDSIANHWQSGNFEKALQEILQAGESLENNKIVGSDIRWMKADCYHVIAIRSDSINNVGDQDLLKLSANIFEELLVDKTDKLFVSGLMDVYSRLELHNRVIELHKRYIDLMGESNEFSFLNLKSRIAIADTVDILRQVEQSNVSNSNKKKLIIAYLKSNKDSFKLEKQLLSWMEDDPDNPSNQYNYAQYLYEKGNLINALSIINASIKLKEKEGLQAFWKYYGLRGAILHSMQQYPEAKKDSSIYFSKRREFFYPN